MVVKTEMSWGLPDGPQAKGMQNSSRFLPHISPVRQPQRCPLCCPLSPLSLLGGLSSGHLEVSPSNGIQSRGALSAVQHARALGGEELSLPRDLVDPDWMPLEPPLAVRLGTLPGTG